MSLVLYQNFTYWSKMNIVPVDICSSAIKKRRNKIKDLFRQI